MINQITYYLVIGSLVSYLLDKLSKISNNEELEFTNWERFLLILFWPVAVLMFIFSFIRGFLGK